MRAIREHAHLLLLLLSLLLLAMLLLSLLLLLLDECCCCTQHTTHAAARVAQEVATRHAGTQRQCMQRPIQLTTERCGAPATRVLPPHGCQRRLRCLNMLQDVTKDCVARKLQGLGAIEAFACSGRENTTHTSLQLGSQVVHG
jgi:hypothetical protein